MPTYNLRVLLTDKIWSHNSQKVLGICISHRVPVGAIPTGLRDHISGSKVFPLKEVQFNKNSPLTNKAQSLPFLHLLLILVCDLSKICFLKTLWTLQVQKEFKYFSVSQNHFCLFRLRETSLKFLPLSLHTCQQKMKITYF